MGNKDNEKCSFILYYKHGELFSRLTDELAGKLIKGIFHYITTDKDPEFNNDTLDMAFIPIRQAIDENATKWKATKAERAEAGRKGGIASGKSRRSQKNKANEAFVSIASKSEANEAVSVSESVSVSEIYSAERISSLALEKMNQLSGSTHTPNDENTHAVLELLRHGYTEAQIMNVVARKTCEWRESEKMRPNINLSSILKPNKFEAYLNAPISLRESETIEIRKRIEKLRQQREEKETALNSINSSLKVLKPSSNREEYTELKIQQAMLEDSIQQIDEMLKRCGEAND